jgi:hypothetical protein
LISVQKWRPEHPKNTPWTLVLFPTVRTTATPSTVHDSSPFESTVTVISRSPIAPLALRLLDNPKHPINGSSWIPTYALLAASLDKNVAVSPQPWKGWQGWLAIGRKI